MEVPRCLITLAAHDSACTPTPCWHSATTVACKFRHCSFTLAMVSIGCVPGVGEPRVAWRPSKAVASQICRVNVLSAATYRDNRCNPVRCRVHASHGVPAPLWPHSDAGLRSVPEHRPATWDITSASSLSNDFTLAPTSSNTYQVGLPVLSRRRACPSVLVGAAPDVCCWQWHEGEPLLQIECQNQTDATATSSLCVVAVEVSG